MRATRRGVVVVALLLGLGAGAAPAAQGTAPASEHRAGAAAKKKRCKKGKVRVRVGKSKVRCVPARKALPKPKAIDVPKAATRFVLNADFSDVRDRRGKPLPSLPKLLDRIHPRAQQALLAATAAGLEQLGEPRVQLARAAAAPCGAGSGSVSSSFDAGGGASVDMTATLGPEASLQLGMENRSGTRRVRLEIEFPACDENGTQLDSCPTADGIVRGRDNQRIGIRAFVYAGDTLTWSQGMSLQGETTFRGVVADDAALDFFEPHNTETATLQLGGSSRGFAPVTIRTLVQRITRVDMPAGEYVLGPSIVDVSIASEGFGGAERRATEAQIAGRMRTEADKQFRTIIDSAITRFRRTEEGWKTPNTCAAILFTPASGTRTLHRGDSGSMEARVDARPGGAPSGASWTIVSSANAPFSPGGASANPASFGYGPVENAGPGVAVTGTFKAVSKAGIAEGTWTQPTEELSITTISGTFGGTYAAAGSIFTWSGSATFTRAAPDAGANGYFAMTSGAYTVTASGLAFGAGSCRQSGTKAITVTGGDLSVAGQGPGRTAPFGYSGGVAGLGPQPMTVTLSDCDDPDLNGTTMVVGLPFAGLDTQGIKQSADGIDFSGSSSLSAGAVSFTWSWVLHGV